MKKTIILSLVMLMGISAKCQDSVYESIFDSSTSVTWFIGQYHTFYNDEYTVAFRIYNDDTLLYDSIKYNYLRVLDTIPKFDSFPDGRYSPEPWHYVLKSDLFGIRYNSEKLLIRESDNNSRLYIRPLAEPGNYELSEDILVMDLNLEVGDTLDHTGLDMFVQLVNGIGSSYDTLCIVADSIYFQDGKKHIRTNYITKVHGYSSKFQDTLTFIEGIGPTLGPLFWRIILERWSDVLLCSEKDGVQIYNQNRIAGGRCFVFLEEDNINTVDSNIYLIYPNPAHEKVGICGLDCSLHTITLVSLSGQEVLKITSYHNNVEINVSNLDAGLYLVHLDGQVIGKVIKQ